MKRFGTKTRELAVEVMVGSFMFAVLVGLCLFTIVLSREQLFSTSYPLEVVFEDVMGLRDGDNVVIRGMTVGKVKSLHLKEDGVHVVTALQRPVRVRKDYSVEIISTSVLGGRYMQIKEGASSQPEVADGTVLRGLPPHDLMVEAAVVVADFKDIMGKIRSGEGTLGKLITDDALYNDTRAAMSDIRDITAKINKGEGTLGKLVNDETLYNDARDVVSDIRNAIRERKFLINLEETVANLNAVTDKINKGQGSLGKLVNDDTLYNDTRDVVSEIKSSIKDRGLLTHLEKSVANLDSITEKVNSGQGTLGKLVNDEGLYTEGKQLITDVRSAVDDLRETSPITTFSSVFFGAF